MNNMQDCKADLLGDGTKPLLTHMRSQKYNLTELCVLALVFLGVIFHFGSEPETTRIYEGRVRSMTQMTCSIQSEPKEFSGSVK